MEFIIEYRGVLCLVLLIIMEELPIISNQKVAIITGGNSGIGRATALANVRINPVLLNMFRNVF